MNRRAGRRTGVLADWNDERGFGFVEAGGARTFVHISAFDVAGGRPQAGDFIEFDLGADPDGRPCAVGATRVHPLGSRPRHGSGRVEWLALSILVAFAVYVAVAIHVLDVSGWVATYYAVVSLVTFLLYVADKRAAVTGGWRTRERALHAAALLGGWPGAVLAQQFVRHKNRKASFQLAFWLAAFANVVLLVWLTTSWPRLAGLFG